MNTHFVLMVGLRLVGKDNISLSQVTTAAICCTIKPFMDPHFNWFGPGAGCAVKGLHEDEVSGLESDQLFIKDRYYFFLL